MRISQMETEQAINVFCKLTPYIDKILNDTEFIDIIKITMEAEKANSTMELMVFGANKVNKLIPIILDKHQDEAYHIISILNDKSIDDVKKQNVLVTIKEVKEIMQDKELIDFFK